MRFTYNLYPSWCNVETDEIGNKCIPPEHELIGELLSWISFLFLIVSVPTLSSRHSIEGGVANLGIIRDCWGGSISRFSSFNA